MQSQAENCQPAELTHEQAQHTQGPWRIDSKNRRIYGPLGTGHSPDSCCQVCIITNVKAGIKQQDANARLIAAAPDLLDACQSFVEAWDKSNQLEKTDVARAKAVAAIAKATKQELPPVGERIIEGPKDFKNTLRKGSP